MHEKPSGGGLPFPDLSIKGYRAFKSLEVPKLGRVTLITGRNNTGKSSILEALHLHTHNATLNVIYGILSSREEYVRWIAERERSADNESVFHPSALFHGFPRLPEDFEPIVISTSGTTRPMNLTLRIGLYVEEEDEDGDPTWVELEGAPSEEHEYEIRLVTETEERKRSYGFETLRRNALAGRIPRSADRVRMPCIPVSPYIGENTYKLGHLWDRIALTDYEKNIVEALQIVDPSISAVSMVGGVSDEATSEGRTAIVRSKNLPRPVPLRSFGDGVNRMFAIALALVNAREGILLIDEFENGLHHTVQVDVWRMIFKLARDLNVQVFATSHSGDAVKAFQRAAAESPEEGVLLRLARRGEKIYPVVFAEDELEIITRDKIEVR